VVISNELHGISCNHCVLYLGRCWIDSCSYHVDENYDGGSCSFHTMVSTVIKGIYWKDSWYQTVVPTHSASRELCDAVDDAV